jgi:membrane protein
MSKTFAKYMMLMNGKFFDIIKNNIFYQCIYNLIRHEAIEYAGYLTYLNVLSVFPFIFIFFAMISLVDETKFGIDFFNIVLSYLPHYVLDTFGKQINEIANGPPSSLMNLALIGAIWTASSSIEALKSIFNKIYLVRNKPAYLRSRLTSVVQFLVIIFAIIATITVFVIIPKFLPKIPNIVQYPIFNNQFTYLWGNLVLLLIVSTMYYTLTSAKISFVSTIPGAIITIILWIISGNSLSFYMINFNQVSVMYGGLASIIITLIFLYIFNLTLIFGAEFNRLFAQRRFKAD